MLSAIILAAGLSTRMGQSKLLLPLKEKSLIRWTAERVIHAHRGGWQEVIVVFGAEGEVVGKEMKGLHVQPIFNPRFADGMSTSLKVGLQAVSRASHGAMIFLGDQPFISNEVVFRMITAFRETGQPIVVPMYGSQRGNPVLFAASQFSDLMAVEGDKGGREVIKRFPERVATVPFPSSVAPSDVDTWEDFEAMCTFVERDKTFLSEDTLTHMKYPHDLQKF